MKEDDLDLYTDYLLSTFRSCSAYEQMFKRIAACAAGKKKRDSLESR
jgi:hypothetical protein